MKQKNSFIGFTLVETVVALGIFAFCIVVLIGVIPVGMRAARSVANEANAIHISSSVMTAWRTARLSSTVTVPNLFSNLSISPGASSTNYFDDVGNMLTDANGASLSMGYQVSTVPSFPNSYRVDLNFRWPVNASTNIQQSRSFSQVFNK
jgi:uncharacterized protein (TIGR02598 family)